MGLLDSILGAATGKSSASGEANPLIGMLGSLLAQSGGLQGLANKFAQSGQENAFQSWVGTGENQPISGNQVQNALGSEQVNEIATRMGVDPAVASALLAEYLPKIVDKLTPAGKIDPTADHQQGLAAMLPSLLQGLSGQSASDQSARA
ncbi:MAG: YidB family protein [Nitrospirota bacterium]|jgi:uncharacterized protein YidB (DUF937 family)